jgi:hypothetical protein
VWFVRIVYLGAQLLWYGLVEFCAASDSLLILSAMGDLVWIAMVTVRVSYWALISMKDFAILSRHSGNLLEGKREVL